MKKSTLGTIIGAALLGVLKSKPGSFTKARKWTQEEIDLLGTMSDAKVAKIIGVSKSAVYSKRKELDVDKVEFTREWTQEDIDLLGTMTDIEASKALGIPVPKIFQKRHELGIPRFERTRQWTQEEIDLLGVMSDVEISKSLGIPLGVIFRKRKELGIHIYSPRRQWTQEDIDLLGTMKDVQVSEILGISPGVVFKKREELGIPSFKVSRQWTQEEIDLLGTISDAKVAKKLGISVTEVRLKRTGLGIGSYGSNIWTPKNIALLGTMSDNRVGKLVGVSAPTVRNKRLEMKIRSYRENQREANRLNRQEILNQERKSRTVDLRLNPDLLKGQDFVTKESSLLKRKDNRGSKSLEVLNGLNPSGRINYDYEGKHGRTFRALAPLGPNMVTVDKTIGGSADDMIRIYRGCGIKFVHDPKIGGYRKQKFAPVINPGDYVTTDLQSAKDYASGGSGVATLLVRKGDLLDDKTDPSYGYEYIYRPGADKEIGSSSTFGSKNDSFERKVIPEGTILYHGTSAPKDWNVEDLDHGMWFANVRQTAEWFIDWNDSEDNANPRLITFRVTRPIELIVLDNNNASDFEDYFGFYPFLSPQEVRDNFDTTNLEGWFIDSNYFGGSHDIFIKNPSWYLEVVETDS
jgi:hypothetical protein